LEHLVLVLWISFGFRILCFFFDRPGRSKGRLKIRNPKEARMSEEERLKTGDGRFLACCALEVEGLARLGFWVYRPS
jgi:hypothetical protein